ncbi:unnamed protein product [Mytilus coruscus]|uniref:Uncharacterized protein n=1 Tax=Mytilus coruscus TaxID=42192 RepID=A0A6J8BQI2_MYTCO|nr:unnamed protein product [Mytilus coruscus]
MFGDERMIFVDSRDVNKRIVVMNNKGSFIKEIKLTDIPFDVTVIDSNTAAVTLYKIKNIFIVDVNLCKILRTITVNNKCYGIRFIDGKLFVSMGDKTIKTFNLSGNVLSTVSKHHEATYCSVMNQTIYYAAEEAAIIYCCDLNGGAQWHFSCEKFEYPKGITHDSSGNVFVACRDVNKVIVIEFSGKESRVLLTCDDGIKRPLAILYNRKSDILLVCNRSGQCFMYKIIN